MTLREFAGPSGQLRLFSEEDYQKYGVRGATLREYTVKHHLINPLKQAKDEGLRDFLRPIFINGN